MCGWKQHFLLHSAQTETKNCYFSAATGQALTQRAPEGCARLGEPILEAAMNVKASREGSLSRQSTDDKDQTAEKQQTPDSRTPTCKNRKSLSQRWKTVWRAFGFGNLCRPLGGRKEAGRRPKKSVGGGNQDYFRQKINKKNWFKLNCNRKKQILN